MFGKSFCGFDGSGVGTAGDVPVFGKSFCGFDGSGVGTAGAVYLFLNVVSASYVTVATYSVPSCFTSTETFLTLLS